MDARCKDKSVVRRFNLCNGDISDSKVVFLYWDGYLDTSSFHKIVICVINTESIPKYAKQSYASHVWHRVVAVFKVQIVRDYYLVL